VIYYQYAKKFIQSHREQTIPMLGRTFSNLFCPNLQILNSITPLSPFSLHQKNEPAQHLINNHYTWHLALFLIDILVFQDLGKI